MGDGDDDWPLELHGRPLFTPVRPPCIKGPLYVSDGTPEDLTDMPPLVALVLMRLGR